MGDYACKVWVTALKGDWKFLRQALSLQRHYNTSEICWMCEATCDNRLPWTDVSTDAPWRRTLFNIEPWDSDNKPAIMGIPYFRLEYVMVDVLHTWYLGAARDVAGSVLAILLRTGFFPQRNIRLRLWQASKRFHEWCRLHQKNMPSRFRFTTDNLNLKPGQYAECKLKGAQTGWVVAWLANMLGNTDSEEHGLCKTALFISDKLMKLMVSLKKCGCNILTEDQGKQIAVMGEAFIKLYLHLHISTKTLTPYLLFHPKPKIHMLHHSFLMAQSTLRNPMSYACWMDEDWLKHLMRIAKATHPRTCCLNTLRRVCLFLKSHLDNARKEFAEKTKGPKEACEIQQSWLESKFPQFWVRGREIRGKNGRTEGKSQKREVNS